MEKINHTPSQDYRKRLRQAREAANLTLAELAHKVDGQSLQSIGQLEREKQHTTLPTIQAIADALGVRIAWVTSGEGAMMQS